MRQKVLIAIRVEIREQKVTATLLIPVLFRSNVYPLLKNLSINQGAIGLPWNSQGDAKYDPFSVSLAMEIGFQTEILRQRGAYHRFFNLVIDRPDGADWLDGN